MKPIITAMFLLVFGMATAFAQTFMPAYTPTIGYKKGYVQLVDGNKIQGTFQTINNIENIKSVSIKDDSDTKQKIDEAQIDKMFIEFSDLDKLSTSNEAASSIKALSHTNFKEIFKADYFIWEHTITPKKGKREILQLVNPGFDSKIKIYRDPMAQETGELSIGGATLSGGIEKSYYFVKQGADVAIKVEKKNYKEQFAEIFGDCPEVINGFSGKQPDWDDFAAHVFAYDQLCSTK